MPKWTDVPGAKPLATRDDVAALAAQIVLIADSPDVTVVPSSDGKTVTLAVNASALADGGDEELL